MFSAVGKTSDQFGKGNLINTKLIILHTLAQLLRIYPVNLCWFFAEIKLAICSRKMCDVVQNMTVYATHAILRHISYNALRLKPNIVASTTIYAQSLATGKFPAD